MRDQATEAEGAGEGGEARLVAIHFLDRHVEHFAGGRGELGKLNDFDVRIVFLQHDLGRLAKLVRLSQVANHLVGDAQNNRGVHVKMTAIVSSQFLPQLVHVIEHERGRVVRVGRDFFSPRRFAIDRHRRNRFRDVRIIEHAVDFHARNAVELELVFSSGNDLRGRVLLASREVDIGLGELRRFEIAVLNRRLITEVLANREVVVDISARAVREVVVRRDLTGHFFHAEGRVVLRKGANERLVKELRGIRDTEEHINDARVDVRVESPASCASWSRLMFLRTMRPSFSSNGIKPTAYGASMPRALAFRKF